MENCHRCRIKNKEGSNHQEVRFHDGTLYHQNRSKDVEMSLDDFINQLNNTKKTAEKRGHIFINDIIPIDTKWNELI